MTRRAYVPDTPSPRHDFLCYYAAANADEIVETALGEGEVRTRGEADITEAFEAFRRRIRGYCEWEEEPPGGQSWDQWLAEVDRLEGVCRDMAEWPVRGTPFKPIAVAWEEPIVSPRGAVVGFADLAITASAPRQTLILPQASSSIYDDGPPWHDRLRRFGFHATDEVRRVMVEVKPEIPSLGELLRQIHKYQHYQARAADSLNEPPTWAVLSPDDRHAEVLAEQGVVFIKVPEGVA